MATEEDVGGDAADGGREGGGGGGTTTSFDDGGEPDFPFRQSRPFEAAPGGEPVLWARSRAGPSPVSLDGNPEPGPRLFLDGPVGREAGAGGRGGRGPMSGRGARAPFPTPTPAPAERGAAPTPSREPSQETRRQGGHARLSAAPRAVARVWSAPPYLDRRTQEGGTPGLARRPLGPLARASLARKKPQPLWAHSSFSDTLPDARGPRRPP